VASDKALADSSFHEQDMLGTSESTEASSPSSRFNGRPDGANGVNEGEIFSLKSKLLDDKKVYCWAALNKHGSCLTLQCAR